MSSFPPPPLDAEIPVDGRHHVQSMLMRESLLDKRVMSSTETPVFIALWYSSITQRVAYHSIRRIASSREGLRLFLLIPPVISSLLRKLACRRDGDAFH